MVKCQCKTKKGVRCKRNVAKGNTKYCKQHSGCSNSMGSKSRGGRKASKKRVIHAPPTYVKKQKATLSYALSSSLHTTSDFSKLATMMNSHGASIVSYRRGALTGGITLSFDVPGHGIVEYTLTCM